MTCTIIGLVVACSGAPVNATSAQSLALLRQQQPPIVNVQVPERPADATGPDTPERALAIMKQHEPKIVLVPMLDEEVGAAASYASAIHPPKRRFGELPWWWSELYDPWWYEPWVAKPWQLEPVPAALPLWW